MSNYDHQQKPPVGTSPPQDPYPAKEDTYPPPGQSAQGNPPAGYTSRGSAPQYVQKPFDDSKPRTGFLEGCLATLCCCCTLDACF